MAGVLWNIGTGVAVVAGSSAACRWARRRCDKALSAARMMPAPSERSFALVVGLEPGRSPGRAQVREQRAFQQALDEERRDGAFLARRAAPTVRSRNPRPG